ncbi:MAG: FAD-dependent oxidoreductase [Planctomycetota bacterium]|nr:FAD-dependent oxidoreductase [Planctomycetota bacterium]
MPSFDVEVPDLGYFERLIACRHACPVHTDASGYVQAVAEGDYELAYRIARGPNPFASICGRVCGAPCEYACRRGTIDRPVSIRAIKRTATERYGVESPKDLRTTLEMSTAAGSLDAEPNGEKVAVVGAGVAGLTCAHDLRRLGYAVTVFEALPKPGGMLRYGVPKFRLPVDLIDNEINAILEMGVELHCGVRIGRDKTLEGLREEGYAAVFLGVGLQTSRTLPLPGSDLEGVVPGLKHLYAFNTDAPIDDLGRVVVIGGGDVAFDCARTAIRLPGTSDVTLICLESLDEMPADTVEILEGDEEGVVRRNRLGPVRFVGENGKVTGLEVRKVERVFDAMGRFDPVLLEGTEEILPCDTVLLAVGQTSDTEFASGVQELELGGGGTVVADFDTGRTSVPWLFAGGDIALGPKLFIDGVAQGQRAAKSIHEFVKGEVIPKSGDRSFACEYVRQGLQHDYLQSARLFPPATEPASRLESTEAPVEVMYEDVDARQQGARCLRCEVETVFDGTKCILCGGCADVCPTWCLRLVTLEEIGMADPSMPNGSAIIKDEDRCIRCAQCAVRCPTDAITMERIVGHEPWQVVRA